MFKPYLLVSTMIIFVFMLVQFSLNSLFIGVLLLFVAFLIVLLLAYKNLTWFGLLFFLMYVGGLLVLFFYVLCMKSNPLVFPQFSIIAWYFGIFSSLLFPFFLLQLYSSLDFSFRNSSEDNSYFLFKSTESFFVFTLACFLLFILFTVNKFTSDMKSAIRPMKF